jgi:hypothetical protein
VLGAFALLGIVVTLIDQSSGGMLEGVGTFFFWAGYVVVASGTSVFLFLFHFLFKNIRPWLALCLTYLIPFVVYQVLVLSQSFRSHLTQVDRLQQRQILADGCIDILAWGVVQADGGGCDLSLEVQSTVGAVIELRPFYRQWYGPQSVHRLPAGETVSLRRSLGLGRPSATYEWIDRPETPCDAFDFRDFRFSFRCGAAPAVVIIYRSLAAQSELEASFGQATKIKRLPEPTHKIRQ